MAISTPNVNMDKLIQDQLKMIESGMPKFISTPMVLDPAFGGTLNQMLTSGAPVDTSGITQAARQEGDLAWRDMLANINQAMAAGGLTGSSAQTARLSQGASDIGTRIGAEGLRAAVAAQEAAAGRRMGAMDTAVQQALAAIQGQNADTSRFNANLGGYGTQLGAQGDLIKALLAKVPMGPAAGAGTSFKAPSISLGKPIGGGSMGVGGGSKGFDPLGFLKNLHATQANPLKVGSGGQFFQGSSAGTPASFGEWLKMNPTLLSILSPAAGQVGANMAGTMASLFK